MRSETAMGGPPVNGLGKPTRLFHTGAVGTMTDAQLLEAVIARRDQAAEAEVEELVIRHGPVVPTFRPSLSITSEEAFKWEYP